MGSSATPDGCNGSVDLPFGFYGGHAQEPDEGALHVARTGSHECCDSNGPHAQERPWELACPKEPAPKYITETCLLNHFVTACGAEDNGICDRCKAHSRGRWSTRARAAPSNVGNRSTAIDVGTGPSLCRALHRVIKRSASVLPLVQGLRRPSVRLPLASGLSLSLIHI